MKEIVNKIDLADKNGVLLHTGKKYCRRNLLVIPRLNPLEISENGTYPVPNGFAGNGAVVVNVVPKKETALVITANGTYVAPAGTVYTSIVVNVPTSSGGTPEGGEGETPHVHKYTSEVIEPSCMQGGYTLYTCECGHSYKSDEKAPLDHDYIDGTCSRCGAADPTYTPDVSEPAKGSYSVNVGDTFRISYEGNSPDVECPGCLTFYIDSNELIFTAVSAGSGTIYIRISDTLIGQYDVTVTAVARYDYNLKVGETFSISYEGSSPTVECPSCLTYYIDGGELVFTAANVGSGTLRLYDSDTLIAEYTIQVAAQESGGDAHIHSYTTEVTKPTCTAAGYTTHTCQCGHSFMDTHVDALGHDYKTEVTPATCEEGGYTTHTCTRCGHSYTDTATEPNGHFWGVDGGWVTDVAATCTKGGTEKHVCNNCGKVETRNTNPLGHNWSDYTVEHGNGFAYECKRCGAFNPIPDETCDHASAEVIEVVAPTCTEDGYTTYQCSMCGHEWDEKSNKRGHNYIAVVTDPTCTAKGYTTHTCSRCNDSYKDSYTDMISHSWSGWTIAIEPDCDDDGSEKRTCSECGKTETNTIEALGHLSAYSPGKEATCTEDGYTASNYCSRCDTEFGRNVIKAKGHTKETVSGYGATCTTAGLTDGVKCSVCGITLTAQTTIPARGHKFESDWTVYKAPTCTAPGVERRYCSNCSYYESRSVPATGHSYTSKVTPATCEEGGYTTYTCSKCGHSYRSDETDPNGHFWGVGGGWVTVVAATCTKGGTEKHTCNNCGKVETRNVPALGHDWGSPEYDDSYSSGQSITCERCGETEEYSS